MRVFGEKENDADQRRHTLFRRTAESLTVNRDKWASPVRKYLPQNCRHANMSDSLMDQQRARSREKDELSPSLNLCVMPKNNSESVSDQES